VSIFSLEDQENSCWLDLHVFLKPSTPADRQVALDFLDALVVQPQAQ